MCFEILFQYTSQHGNSPFLGPGVVVYVISVKEIAQIYFNALVKQQKLRETICDTFTKVTSKASAAILQHQKHNKITEIMNRSGRTRST